MPYKQSEPAMTRDISARRRSQTRRRDRPSDRSDRRERPSRQKHAPQGPRAPSRHPASPAEEEPPRPVRREEHHPLQEQALFYDPPYESERVDRLARHLVTYLKPSCGLRDEAVVLTPRDCFRLDVLVEVQPVAGNGTQRVGLLFGERAEDQGAPRLYDALLVGAGAVDVCYRFNPEGLSAHLTDALFLMAQWDPMLFDRPDRLCPKASLVARDVATDEDSQDVRLVYPTPSVEVRPGRIPERPAALPDLAVRRLRRGGPQAWMEDYNRALDFFEVSEARRHTHWARSA